MTTKAAANELYLAYLRSDYAAHGNGGVTALAADAGLHHNTVYRAFAGQNPTGPAPATLIRIADTLGVRFIYEGEGG